MYNAISVGIIRPNKCTSGRMMAIQWPKKAPSNISCNLLFNSYSPPTSNGGLSG